MKRINANMPPKLYRELMASLKVRSEQLSAQTAVTVTDNLSAWIRDCAQATIKAFPPIARK